MTTWEPVTPVVDTPEQPHSYWLEPKIGDCVRVRLSGECTTVGKVKDPYSGRYRLSGHPEFTDGLTGTVIRCSHCWELCCDLYPGHPYRVRLDEQFGTDKTYGAYYAASELELLP